MLLLLEPSGNRPIIRLTVDKNAVVGTYVDALVQQLAYPTTTPNGQRVIYHLRIVGSAHPLPHMRSFRDVQIRSGTHVLLESASAEFATIPLKTNRLSSTSPKAVPSLWKRRDFLLWTFVTLAIGGAGTGMITSLAERYLAGQQKATVTTPVSTPRGASVQFTFSAHQHIVRSLGWSPAGNIIASGADDAKVILWDAKTGQVMQTITHPTSVLTLAWSPEGMRIATGAGNQIAFFNALSGSLLAHATHQKVSSVAWASNNQMQVVSGGADTRVFVWDTTNYGVQGVFVRHDTPVETVSWAPDGRHVASASRGGAVRVWNAETLAETHGFFQNAPVPVYTCAFSPTGTSLAIGAENGETDVWENGLLCQQQRIGNDGLMCQDRSLHLSPSANAPIRSLAWSPDGRYLATGCENGSWSVWARTHPQAPLFTVAAASGIAVQSIEWAPSGKTIATAVGNTVLLWRLLP